MSGFAGVFSVKGSGFNDELKNQLSSLINRDSSNVINSYVDEYLILYKFDVQAFLINAWNVEDSGVAALAGDPVLIDKSEQYCDRSIATIKLQQTILQDDTSQLLKCRGTYCGVSYCTTQNRLNLFVDKLGVRPIYYTVQNEMLFFSTALRVLEQLKYIHRSLDMRGAVEYAIFDYCLDNHTGYQNIHSLEAGHYLTYNHKGLAKTEYWALEKAITLIDEKERGLSNLYDNFTKAVSFRLGNDEKVSAMLSGGLDSRCVATELWKQKVSVDTFTFGDQKSLDCQIARLYADKLGFNHVEKEFVACDYGPGWPLMVANEITKKIKKGVDFSRSKLVWSGDGGSVSVGRTYLDKGLVSVLTNGNYQQAANLFSKPFNNKILIKSLRADIINYPTQFIVDFLANKKDMDSVNKMLMFLMENDQRRHLCGFFENIDLYGIDFWLPFYDSEVVTSSLSIEPNYGLYHQMYNDWLGLFPSEILEVPWQHYPGHLPSPLPLPEEGLYQWGDSENSYDFNLIAEAGAIISEKNKVFNTPFLYLCLFLTKYRLRDMSWLLRQVVTINKFAKHVSDGETIK